MKHRHRAWILVALSVAACDPGPAEPVEGPFLGAQAEVYLDAALDVMEFNSIRRYEIDWPAFREAARADAEQAGAVAPSDTYPAIEAALERIGDNHSFFRPPAGAQLAASSEAAAGPAAVDPSTLLVAPGVGYVDVPAYSGGGAEGDALAATYHRLIENVDSLGTSCRWVIDLRGNTGGNMWPMLAGIGPVLGADTVGYFVDPDSVLTSWFYEAGIAGVNDIAIATASPSYELVSPRPFVAVLTDGETASSGEAIAVAFRGRAGARSFGESTWGVSTANAAFPLSDGAVIFLTVATMADRLGTVYGQELVPDEFVVGGTKTGDVATDAVLDAAVTWLQGQVCS
jgi:carboxyl-terminal processing protease